MMMPNKNVCLLSHNIHINATDEPRLLKAKKCGIYLWVGHEREHSSTGKRERTHGKVGRANSVHAFGSFTADLHALVAWLKERGVTTVAMESTGVYWIPVYDTLERAGFEVFLVNAHHVKSVTGRKSDLLDCQWIQKLHSCGLLKGSFRPDEKTVSVRSLFRHRADLVREAASSVQRMQKAFTQMNVQLHHAVADITGKTGMAIIEAILKGERRPMHLAKLRDPRCKNDEAMIAKALTGTWRTEHLFTIEQHLATWKHYHAKIA